MLVSAAVAVWSEERFVAVEARDQSIRELTSGRWQRAELTIDVAREQPLVGVGLGAQPKVSRELGAGRSAREARFVSHTTPLTVAAELGLVGFALYALLLAPAARMLMLLPQAWPALALTRGSVICALFTHACVQRVFEIRSPGSRSASAAAYLTVPAAVRETASARRRALARGGTAGADQVTRARPRRPRRPRDPGRDRSAEIGVDGWAFEPGPGVCRAAGAVGAARVRAADREFDVGLLRAAGSSPPLVTALAAALVLAGRLTRPLYCRSC